MRRLLLMGWFGGLILAAALASPVQAGWDGVVRECCRRRPTPSVSCYPPGPFCPSVAVSPVRIAYSPSACCPPAVCCYECRTYGPIRTFVRRLVGKPTVKCRPCSAKIRGALLPPACPTPCCPNLAVPVMVPPTPSPVESYLPPRPSAPSPPSPLGHSPAMPGAVDSLPNPPSIPNGYERSNPLVPPATLAPLINGATIRQGRSSTPPVRLDRVASWDREPVIWPAKLAER